MLNHSRKLAKNRFIPLTFKSKHSIMNLKLHNYFSVGYLFLKSYISERSMFVRIFPQLRLKGRQISRY